MMNLLEDNDRDSALVRTIKSVIGLGTIFAIGYGALVMTSDKSIDTAEKYIQDRLPCKTYECDVDRFQKKALPENRYRTIQ